MAFYFDRDYRDYHGYREGGAATAEGRALLYVFLVIDITGSPKSLLNVLLKGTF